MEDLRICIYIPNVENNNNKTKAERQITIPLFAIFHKLDIQMYINPPPDVHAGSIGPALTFSSFFSKVNYKVYSRMTNT